MAENGQGEREADRATFRVGPLVILPRLLEEAGVEPADLFDAAGFAPKEFTDPDHRLDFRRADRLLKACVDATGSDDLGLQIGQQVSPSHLGLVGFLAQAAPTVEKALQSLIAHLDLHDEGIALYLKEDGEYASLTCAILVPSVSATEQIYDLSAALMFQLLSGMCGSEHAPVAVRLPRHPPADPRPYRRFFGVPVHFNELDCRIDFPRECLQRPTDRGDPLLYEFLEKEAVFAHRLHGDDLLEALPVALRRALLQERFHAREVADSFGLHERTLHRRLRAAGTSFRRELDKARRIAGEELLLGTDLSIGDIAAALGYADSSGFIRAFRRWCGESPEVWRRDRLDADRH